MVPDTLFKTMNSDRQCFTENTATAKGGSRDALRTGLAEDTASAKLDGRDALRTGITEDTAPAK